MNWNALVFPPNLFQGLLIVAVIVFALYSYFYFENLHFHITHGYAHLGYPVAQHQVGQRYLHGKNVSFIGEFKHIKDENDSLYDYYSVSQKCNMKIQNVFIGIYNKSNYKAAYFGEISFSM